MNSNEGGTPRRRITLRTIGAGFMVCLLAGLGGRLALQAQNRFRRNQAEIPSPKDNDDVPEAEFHMARAKYPTRGGGGSHGYFEPWWAIDYPVAEQHFLPALRRLTHLSVADDSIHLDLTDKRLFDYPFLFLQQPGRGNWRPTDQEAAGLRDYLMRGGFLLVDDFHGEYDWAIFEQAIHKVLPGRPIVEIPDTDPLMHVFYDLGDRVQIPGLRHLYRKADGSIGVQMQGPPHWRGIYDDRGRLIVGINFNIDMGDGWEHADTPYYPAEMTGMAYRLGINYVIYAMTH
jgi:Domain of unknown function (DUF4159)